MIRGTQQHNRRGNTIIITMGIVMLSFGMLMIATNKLASANQMLSLSEAKQQAMAAAEAVAALKESRLVEIAANNDLGLLVTNPDSEIDASIDPDSPWAGTIWFGDCLVRWFVEPVKIEGYDQDGDPVWTVNVPPSPSGTAELLDDSEFIENFDFYHFRIAARAYYLSNATLLEESSIEDLEAAGELPWQNKENGVSSVLSQRVVQLRLHSLFKYAIFYASEKDGVGDLEMGPAYEMEVQGAVHSNSALYICGGGGIAGDKDYMPIDGEGITYNGFDAESPPSVVGVKGVYRMLKELFLRAQADDNNTYADANTRPEYIPISIEDEDYDFNAHEGEQHPIYPKDYQGGSYYVGDTALTTNNDTRSTSPLGDNSMKDDFGGTVRDGVYGDAKTVKTLANIKELAGYPFTDHALAPPEDPLWVFPVSFTEPGIADYAPNALDVIKRWTVLPNTPPAKYISITGSVKNFSSSPSVGLTAKVGEYAAKLYYTADPDYNLSYEKVFYAGTRYWRPHANISMDVDVLNNDDLTYGADGILDNTDIPALYPVTCEGLRLYYQRLIDNDNDGNYDTGDTAAYTVNSKYSLAWNIKDVYDPYGFETWPVDNNDFAETDATITQTERINGYPGTEKMRSAIDSDTGDIISRSSSFSPNEVPGFYLDIAMNGQPDGDNPDERGLIIRERKIKKPGSTDGRPLSKPRQYVITLDDSGVLVIDDGLAITEYPADPSMFTTTTPVGGDGWHTDVSSMTEYNSWVAAQAVRYYSSLSKNAFKPAWLEQVHISKDFGAEAQWDSPIALPYTGKWQVETLTGTFGFGGVNAVSNDGGGEGEWAVSRYYKGDVIEKWPQYEIIGTGAGGAGTETLFSLNNDYSPSSSKWKVLGIYDFDAGIKPTFKIKQIRNTYRYEPAFTYNYDYTIHPKWFCSRLGYDSWKNMPNAAIYADEDRYPYGLEAPASDGLETEDERNQRYLNIIALCELNVPPNGCSLTTEEYGTYPNCHKINWLAADGVRLRYVDENQYTIFGENYAQHLASEYIVQFGTYDITDAFFQHGLSDYKDRVSAGLATVATQTRRIYQEPDEGRYTPEEYMIAWDNDVFFRRKSEHIYKFYFNKSFTATYAPGDVYYNAYTPNKIRKETQRTPTLTLNVDMVLDFLKNTNVKDIIPGQSGSTDKLKDNFNGMVYMSRTRRSNGYEPRLPRWHHDRLNLRYTDRYTMDYGFGLGLIDGHADGTPPLGLQMADPEDPEDVGQIDDAWKTPSGPNDTYLSAFRLRYAEDMDFGRDYESGTYSRKKGLTWITPNQIYLHGDFNTTTHADSNGDQQVTPLALFADFVSILSPAWVDIDHQSWYSKTTKAETTLNTSLITHNIPTWMDSYKTGFTHPSEGAHNIVRLHERWGFYNTPLNLIGSLVVLNEARFNKCDINYGVYSAPDRNFQFNTDLFTRAGQPPFTPYGVKVVRTVNTVDTLQ